MKRRLLITGGLLVSWHAAARGGRAGQRKKQRSITRNFRTLLPISLSENGAMARPYPAVLTVSGFKRGKITRVQLTLRGLSLPYAQLLHILLVAPNGKSVEVLGNVGDISGAAGLVITLDDKARHPLPYLEPLTSGTFKPTRFYAYPYPDPAPPEPHEERLAAFNSGNPNGDWKLFVMEDNALGAGGINAGYELKITAKVK